MQWVGIDIRLLMEIVKECSSPWWLKSESRLLSYIWS